MTSRVSWSVEGIEPSVRERAETAARRAGMSLGDWMNAVIGGPADHANHDVAEIYKRLDSITRQIEQISYPAGGTGNDPLARHLNDAISRLDDRLSQISQNGSARSGAGYSQTSAPHHRSPPLSPPMMPQADFAIAEIIARQAELNGIAYRALRTAEQTAAPDFSGFERQLLNIASQIENLHRPGNIEQSIATFRSELSEIRQTIMEALPRHAIESLEVEIRSLGRRIDETRQSGTDNTILAGIERALSDVYSALRSLTPAEKLAGFEEAIRDLGTQVDKIVRSSHDPDTLHKFEEAITALRGIVANVASNAALSQLSDNVAALSYKVDQLTQAGDNSGILSALEQRITVLTTALEQRQPGVGDTVHFDTAVRAISDRLDNLQADHDRPSDIFDAVKRELSEIRFSQSETDRRTQDSLTAVNSTLGHVVDRLLVIEDDLRIPRTVTDTSNPSERSNPEQRISMPEVPQPKASQAIPRPELSDPAATQVPAMPKPMVETPAAPLLRAPDEAARPTEAPQAQSSPRGFQLPPDFPLEPGSRPHSKGLPTSLERIAASEDALSEISGSSRAPVSSSNFIQAARRAAQAAAATPASVPKGKPNRVTVLSDNARSATKTSSAEESQWSSRIRVVLVGASVIVIVLGTFKMAMNLLEGRDSPTSTPAAELSSTLPTVLPPAPQAETLAPVAPSMTSPIPLDRQSRSAPPTVTPPARNDDVTPVPTPETAPNTSDETGSIATPNAAVAPAHSGMNALIQASDRASHAINIQTLRNAAAKGDPGAAYEIAARYIEGKGVAINLEEAVKWYERAAGGGIVPALFRLGTLYEKGLGVSKDIGAARRYYIDAAERGNAKAMHNLAVLEADGGGAKAPNYKSAAQWFHKAAEHGIADSQYNLGILYARGIGVEQNLAESFKWLSLAAAHGDADASRKRDDIAKRLDPQSLAAAKLAIQTFTPKSQPEDAASVAVPPNGWNDVPTTRTSGKSTPAKSAATQSASR